MLQGSRASTAAVVTGTSSVASGIANNAMRAGRWLDSDPIGLVIEESRANDFSYSNPTAGQWGTSTLTLSTSVGPDGNNTAGRASDTDVVNIGFALWTYTQTINSSYAYQLWYRDVSGVAGTKIGANFNGSTGMPRFVRPIPSGWTRYFTVSTSSAASTTNVVIIPAADTGSDVGTADFWGCQAELGKFATSPIITTGTAVSRAGERLWHPYSALLTDNGRLGLEFNLQPYGAPSDYSTAPYLWSLGSGDYVTLDPATGKVSVRTGGGAVYTTATGASWSQRDSVDLWVEAGGSAMQTVVKYRRNGGAASTLGTGSPQPALSSANAPIDLLCSGTASQFTAIVRSMATYAAGSRPGWAT